MEGTSSDPDKANRAGFWRPIKDVFRDTGRMLRRPAFLLATICIWAVVLKIQSRGVEPLATGSAEAGVVASVLLLSLSKAFPRRSSRSR